VSFTGVLEAAVVPDNIVGYPFIGNNIGKANIAILLMAYAEQYYFGDSNVTGHTVAKIKTQHRPDRLRSRNSKKQLTDSRINPTLPLWRK